MSQIHAKQIKAARAILDWSQDDLAQKAGLAVNTIRNLETGFAPSGKTAEAIRQAIEDAGLEFIGKQGVRERSEEVIIYDGPDSADILLDDMVRTLKRHGGDILAVMQGAEMIRNSLGLLNQRKWQDFVRQTAGSAIMGLIPDDEPQGEDSEIIYRSLSPHQIGPMPYFIYGNRHVLVLQEGIDACRFIVFKSAAIAQAYRLHFLALWPKALPIQKQTQAPRRYATR